MEVGQQRSRRVGQEKGRRPLTARRSLAVPTGSFSLIFVTVKAPHLLPSKLARERRLITAASWSATRNMRAAALLLLVHAPCGYAYLLREMSCSGALISTHRASARASAAVSAAVPRSAAAVASQATDAMLNGCAHVEPNFLSGGELDAARADMLSVLGQVTAGDEFESIQTDLLNPEFRRSLPSPLPFAGLLERLDELRPALAQSTGRSLLEGGGLHLMRYPISSGFMRHVDEDPEMYEPVRNSISFLLYLTPQDWTADNGGALCVYEGGEDTPPRQIMPVSGTLVIYDSSLEHSVLPTQRPRHLVSGRFRQVDEDWQVRWGAQSSPSVPV